MQRAVPALLALTALTGFTVADDDFTIAGEGVILEVGSPGTELEFAL